MSIQDANLAQLIHQRYTDKATEGVARQALGASDRDLRRLLRNHKKKGIWDAKEIRFREAFDALLWFYGLLELGCLSGVFAETLPADVAEPAQRILSHAEVRPYYLDYYPLPLPSLLLKRLSSRKRAESAATVEDDLAPSLYFELLDIVAILDDDHDLDIFLGLLDGYVYGKFSLREFVSLLENPEQFLQSMGKNRGTIGSSTRGFRTFLAFCAGFDDLLNRVVSTSGTRPLAKPFWGLCAYWFQRLKEGMGDQLGRGVRLVESWTGLENQKISHSDLRRVFMRLASFRYGTR